MRPFTLLFLVTLVACNATPKDPSQQVDQGTIKNETYTNPELGWTIEIPKGYTIVSKDQVQAQQQRGLNSMEKATGSKVNTDSLKNLLSFAKDKFNNFGSTSQPFHESNPGEYQANFKQLPALLYQTFSSQGIKTDTSSGTTNIQGLDFNTIYITIFSREGKVILNQIMYSRYHKGYDFGININYNNEEDKKLLTDALNKSQFK